MVMVSFRGAAPAATLLPLVTEEATPLPSMQVETVLAGHYSRNQRFPHFTPAGAVREQHLVTAPELHLRFGVADWVEIQASFAMLYLDEELASGDRNRKLGAGDARLFTKVRIVSQRAWRPALAARFGAKLPNADFDDRLGTDETDFEIEGLGSYDFGPVATHVNLGMALLGNPGPAIETDTSFEAGGQDDLFLWAVALTTRPYPVGSSLQLQWLVEAAGNAGSHFDNDRAAVRFGPELHLGRWLLFAGASVGLVSGSEDIGASAGVGYRWSLAELWGNSTS
ncbi:MAG TPA: hypothetical protein VEB21_11030 [Terriglobales bacterium]|nr:hypothetical protein [Terriglobales bacterium]